MLKRLYILCKKTSGIIFPDVTEHCTVLTPHWLSSASINSGLIVYLVDPVECGARARSLHFGQHNHGRRSLFKYYPETKRQ